MKEFQIYGTRTTIKENGNEYKIFIGRREGNRSLGRAKHNFVDKIKMHILDIFCYIYVDSIELNQAGTNGKLQPTTGSFTSP